MSYEDAVLALLPDHDGRLVVRTRVATSDPADNGAYETQIIAIARTQLQYVDLV